MLFLGLLAGFGLGAALGIPFDIDVGAEHAVLHLVFAATVVATATWLFRNGTAAFVSRFASCSAAGLAFVQLLEGLAAIGDPRGGSVAHEVPNVVSLRLVQPLVILALIMLAAVALRRRTSA
ncbi:MAG: hypothetical protein M3N32_02975 [Actinomycetota bacterium]|nr:hypothetical protein [Actinomycetota bacterium]